jgi:hypothetical protein
MWIDSPQAWCFSPEFCDPESSGWWVSHLYCLILWLIQPQSPTLKAAAMLRVGICPGSRSCLLGTTFSCKSWKYLLRYYHLIFTSRSGNKSSLTIWGYRLFLHDLGQGHHCTHSVPGHRSSHKKTADFSPSTKQDQPYWDTVMWGDPVQCR